jgi:hypothetical protein
MVPIYLIRGNTWFEARTAHRGHLQPECSVLAVGLSKAVPRFIWRAGGSTDGMVNNHHHRAARGRDDPCHPGVSRLATGQMIKPRRATGPENSISANEPPYLGQIPGTGGSGPGDLCRKWQPRGAANGSGGTPVGSLVLRFRGLPSGEKKSKPIVHDPRVAKNWPKQSPGEVTPLFNSRRATQSAWLPCHSPPR